MKYLVDTTVWSLSLRRKRNAPLNPGEQKKAALLSEAIVRGQVAMLGPIRQELLSGIKEHAQYERLLRRLRDFRDEPLKTEDHEEAARLYNLCRSRGVEGGAIDILICAVALQRGWEILSNDKGLDRCMEIARSDKQKMHLP
jgi:predicted nucleic acid-binding protein